MRRNGAPGRRPVRPAVASSHASRRRRTAVHALLAAALSAAIAVAPLTTASASAPAPTVAPSCPASAAPTATLAGRAALDHVADRLPQVAALNGMSASRLSSVLSTDPTARLDRCSRLLFVDAPAPAAPVGPDASAAAVISAQSALDPTGDAFSLSSRPGSLRTLYLDFVGYTLGNTGWSGSYGMTQGKVLAPYDTDNNPGAFSTSELNAIREIWLRVSEDYAPFDVNVTTADPGLAALDRSGTGDTAYGTRVVISSDSTVGAACTCGGIAFVGVIGAASSHEFYQPALVWSKQLGNGYPKYVAEAASHEAGHTFGLVHDGVINGAGYYEGQGAWAPIMGGSYTKPISTWDHGEYTGANNSAQDDLAVIAANASVMADDHGNTKATATAVASVSTTDGLITSATDSDWFAVPVPGKATTIKVTPQAVGGNLDSRLDLYDSSGTLVGSSNPAVPVPPVSATTTTGLDASLTFASLPAGTYYAVVSGTGQGDPAVDGYSAYASLGRYQLVVNATGGPVAFSTASLPAATAGSAYSTKLSASGGSGSALTYSLTAGTLPTGLTLTSGGTLSGTPTATGSFPLTFSATDGTTTPGTVSLTFVVGVNHPAVVTGTWPYPDATTGAAYSGSLQTTGASSSVSWSVSAGALPPGITADAQGTGVLVHGTPTTTGTYTATLTRADSLWGGSVSTGVTIHVYAPSAVTPTTLPDAVPGAAYTTVVGVTGGSGVRHWTGVQGVPAGLSFDATTGTVSGTAPAAGTYSITATLVDDRTGQQVPATLTLHNYAALGIATTSLRGAVAGSAYTAKLVVSGGSGSYAWQPATGVPAPLGFDTSTGTFTGTAPAAGSYAGLAVTVVDQVTGKQASAVFPLTVYPSLAVPAAPPRGMVGARYATTLHVAGGSGHVHWTVAGGLPTGLTFTATTGTVSGTPKVAGTFRSIVLTATDDLTGQQSKVTTSIVVYKALAVTTSRVAAARHGRAYVLRLAGVGGNGTYRWSLAAGRLPGAVSLSSSGRISGAPRRAGTYRFTVRLNDTAGHSVRRSFVWIVR
jgi:hypothetical protein